jgi:hypothetical protein
VSFVNVLPKSMRIARDGINKIQRERDFILVFHNRTKRKFARGAGEASRPIARIEPRSQKIPRRSNEFFGPA